MLKDFLKIHKNLKKVNFIIVLNVNAVLAKISFAKLETLSPITIVNQSKVNIKILRQKHKAMLVSYTQCSRHNTKVTVKFCCFIHILFTF